MLEQMMPPGMTPNQFVAAFTQNLQRVSRNPFFIQAPGTGPNVWPTVTLNGVTMLDATQPPLQLLAIVNRIDQHASGNGTIRFVYGVVTSVPARDLGSHDRGRPGPAGEAGAVRVRR
jgi:hypothetical protein